MTTGSAPLPGISVLELGNFIAAPFAGKVFAEFGAEVIKIERRAGGSAATGHGTGAGHEDGGGDSAGAGQIVDVALYEAVFSLLESLVPDFDAYGVVRQRSGGKLPGVVPSDVYQCKDGRAIVIGGNSNAVFGRMMRAIGRDDLADDPQLADGPGRSARADQLERIICDWAASVTMDDAMAALDAAAVPAGGVSDAESIGTDPQFAAREMLQPMPVRVEQQIEQIRFPGIVPKIDGNPVAPRWVGPEVASTPTRY